MVLIDKRLTGLYRPLNDLLQGHPRLAQFELAAADAADIQQIIDQARHLPDLPVDDVLELRSGAPLPLLRRICTAFRIGASGLRNSCARVARNASLR